MKGCIFCFFLHVVAKVVCFFSGHKWRAQIDVRNEAADVWCERCYWGRHFFQTIGGNSSSCPIHFFDGVFDKTSIEEILRKVHGEKP